MILYQFDSHRGLLYFREISVPKHVSHSFYARAHSLVHPLLVYYCVLFWGLCGSVVFATGLSKKSQPKLHTEFRQRSFLKAAERHFRNEQREAKRRGSDDPVALDDMMSFK